MCSSSWSRGTEAIVVMTVHSGVNIEEKRGPLTDMVEDCR